MVTGEMGQYFSRKYILFSNKSYTQYLIRGNVLFKSSSMECFVKYLIAWYQWNVFVIEIGKILRNVERIYLDI
jgi:hypothetical protein